MQPSRSNLIFILLFALFCACYGLRRVVTGEESEILGTAALSCFVTHCCRVLIKTSLRYDTSPLTSKPCHRITCYERQGYLGVNGVDHRSLQFFRTDEARVKTVLYSKHRYICFNAFY